MYTPHTHFLCQLCATDVSTTTAPSNTTLGGSLDACFEACNNDPYCETFTYRVNDTCNLFNSSVPLIDEVGTHYYALDSNFDCFGNRTYAPTSFPATVRNRDVGEIGAWKRNNYQRLTNGGTTNQILCTDLRNECEARGITDPG